MKKTTYILTLLLAASLAFGKTSVVLKLDSAAEADRVKTINAKREFVGGKLQATFSEQNYSLVYIEVPRPDIKYWEGKMISAEKLVNITLPQNVWAGYERLLFDYTNPGETDLDIAVWLIDHTGYMSYLAFKSLLPQLKTSETKDIVDKQMGEVKAILKTGKGTASIDLGKEIFTVDKKRVIDLSDIRVIAFAVGGKECKAGISNIRLEGSSETAGSLPIYPCTIFCNKYPDKGYNGNANFCPWCGEEFDLPTEPGIAAGSKLITAAHDVQVGPRGGGGENIINRTGSGRNTGIYYFDSDSVNATTYLDFNIDSKELSALKTAELRILTYYTSEIPSITSAVRLYSVKDKYILDDKKMTWTSQPPVEEFLALSGNYLINNKKKTAQQWYVLDITEYLKKAVKAGKSRLFFKLQGWTTINTYKAQQDTYTSFPRYNDPDKSKRPYIYVE